MKKLILLLIFFIIPIVYSLTECDSPLEQLDIPCSIITTYEFDTACPLKVLVRQ